MEDNKVYEYLGKLYLEYMRCNEYAKQLQTMITSKDELLQQFQEKIQQLEQGPANGPAQTQQVVSQTDKGPSEDTPREHSVSTG
jgi:uncharacterized circularly permuted ATP-grasp superfamily protein